MTLHRKLLLLAFFCIALGLAGLTPLAYFSWQNKVAVAQSSPVAAAPVVTPAPTQKPTPATPVIVSGKPLKLIIPSLSIDLVVADGAYNAKTGAWTLSRDQAHYALPSAQPNNENGNTLIYGHYRREVFARLHKITPGALVHIDTENGYRFTYTYRNTQAVNPSDTSILAYQGKPQLTIQTCSGAFMQNRQLFYFDLADYKKLF